MRPRSGGSRRISNWLEPAWAREAMATGSPAIDTLGAVVVVDAADVVGGVVATLAAAMPSVGTSPAARLAPLAAACPVDAVPSADAVPPAPSPCAVAIVLFA